MDWVIVDVVLDDTVTKSVLNSYYYFVNVHEIHWLFSR